MLTTRSGCVSLARRILMVCQSPEWCCSVQLVTEILLLTSVQTLAVFSCLSTRWKPVSRGLYAAQSYGFRHGSWIAIISNSWICGSLSRLASTLFLDLLTLYCRILSILVLILPVLSPRRRLVCLSLASRLLRSGVIFQSQRGPESLGLLLV